MTPASSPSESSAKIGREVLVRGTIDWVMLSEVRDIAAEYTGDDSWEVHRDFGLRALRDLLDAGLVLVGDYSDDSGFVAWTTPNDESLRRIHDGWGALGDALNMGDVAWICNTPAGDAQGRRYGGD